MTYRIYRNVSIGQNARIGDYVIIGLPPMDKVDGQLETVIGDNAVIRSHTVIYAGNIIGINFTTGHSVLIRGENRIGNYNGSLSAIFFQVLKRLLTLGYP